MVKLNKKELVQMNKAELLEKKKELNKELMRVNTQIATGTLPESPGKAKQIKKIIARILTILKNKEKIKEVKEKDE